MLADTAAEAVDSRTVKYLLKVTLKLKQKEEEEKERLEALQLAEEAKKRSDEMKLLVAVPRDLRTPAQMRRFDELSSGVCLCFFPARTKKRRKRRLPRSPHVPRRPCAHAAQVPTVHLREASVPRQRVGHSSVALRLVLSVLGMGSDCDSGGSCATCCVVVVFTEYNSHWIQAPRGTLPVMGAMTMVLPSGSIGIYVHIRASGLRAIPSLTLWTVVSAAAMVSPMPWQVWARIA